jgi:hypothetical protein
VVAVSATVQEQCIVRAESHSASCSGHAVYGVGVTRETLVMTDQLTGAGEYAQTSAYGQLAAASWGGAGGVSSQMANPVVGDGARAGVYAAAARTVEATRVTYSF